MTCINKNLILPFLGHKGKKKDYLIGMLEKAEELEIKLPTSAGSLKNKRIPEKHLLLLY